MKSPVLLCSAAALLVLSACATAPSSERSVILRRGKLIVTEAVPAPAAAPAVVETPAPAAPVAPITPVEAVTPDKLRRLRRLAGEWLSVHGSPGRAIRIDVVAVWWPDGAEPQVHHLRAVG